MQGDRSTTEAKLSRADLELELARLVLAHARRREQRASSDADAQTGAWFEAAAMDLLQRLPADLRPYAVERIRNIVGRETPGDRSSGRAGPPVTPPR